MASDSASHADQRPLTGWEKNLLGVRIDRVHTLLPGLVWVIVLAWFSLWLSEFLGVSVLGFEKTPISAVMVAILLGIILRTLIPLPANAKPGLTFSVKKILRLGIILLGIRLTLFDVFRLGLFGVPIVIVCIISALLITSLINRWVGLPRRLGTLIATGTAICGVSAIVATAPAIDAEEEESAYAVAVVTIFGLLATLLYPYLVHQIFQGDALKAGLFLGTSVHDTSQVVGSARVYADVYAQSVALDAATITKLVRNVFMALVIPLMAFLHNRSQESSSQSSADVRVRKLFPLFVLGFLTVAILRTIGDAGLQTGANAFGVLPGASWSTLVSTIRTWAGRFLVIALAGVGLSTDIRNFKALGLKPFFVGLAAALSVGVVSYLTITLLGDLVSL
ncbi:MAG: putative sulfate exporter family transporter [Anaerolineales bacterium]|jgi:uncharacterized integral membrane protein (TIGR00698 family)